ncbi:hypothetical protein MNAN1_003453 [Malassezia nana]|uniref:Uncharacterized protein n=1 Tax=Malassezia nana TaxID=180528 RepID=A0AAF0EU19_9BASI|nr:hypothetical protein MNAN1_003453 [Malassezia nana]
MDRPDALASSEAILSPPPPFPGSWDRPAKPIRGAWSIQSPVCDSTSTHRQPSLADSDRDIYSEALSPWLHATPEYRGSTLPAWQDASTDTETVVDEDAAEFSPVDPPPVTTDATEEGPGYRYTSIIDSIIPEESFELSHSVSSPASPQANMSPDLVGLGMSGNIAGFAARQAYHQELRETLPAAPAPMAPSTSLPYRMPPIEGLRIHKQETQPQRVSSGASSEDEAPRAARAISGASFVFSPATAMAENTWQSMPPPPPILRPRLPSLTEQDTIVTGVPTSTSAVRLPDTHTYTPPLQTIHIVRGSPPPWATPSPRAEMLELGGEKTAPAPATTEPAVPETNEHVDTSTTSVQESSNVYVVEPADATLVGSADTKLSSSDPLKDGWSAPNSDVETSALGLHIPEPLPTPFTSPESWRPAPTPQSAEWNDVAQAPPAPPTTDVWSELQEPAPAVADTETDVGLASRAHVVDASYAATPRAVSYGTDMRTESYVSPIDQPPTEAAFATSPAQAVPPPVEAVPPPVETVPPPTSAPPRAAPALVPSSTYTQGLRPPLDYSVPFPLLTRRARHASARVERRLSSMDRPREPAPQEDTRGRASLDERRLPSQHDRVEKTLRTVVEPPRTQSSCPIAPPPPPTPPPKSWLLPTTTAVPRASAPPYARDYGVVLPPLPPQYGAPVQSKEGRHVWLDVDADTSHLSMLGAVDEEHDSFHFESYFAHSLQRIRTELMQLGIEAPPRRSAARAAAQEAARVAARAGVHRTHAAPPINLTHNAPPVSVDNVGSPLMSLDEFTYVMDEHGVALSTPHLGVQSPSVGTGSAWPSLPPLDTNLPEEHELMGDAPPISWVFHDEGRSAFAEEPMPTDHRLPLEFVTKPNSVLSRGRPVKKTEQESVFYCGGPDVRRRRVAQPPTRSVPLWNFEEGDEEPSPAPSPQLLHDTAAPQTQPKAATPPPPAEPSAPETKGTSWWRRKMPSPTKASSVETPPTSETRTSTSTNATMKYGRRTAPPGFEPSQPGKYFLAGTVSLPTLNIARTPEQRARHETGLAETEPSLIQSLLAAPSSSTVRKGAADRTSTRV